MHISRPSASTRFGRRLGGYLGQCRIRYHFAAKNTLTPTWVAEPAVDLRLPPVPGNHVPLRTLAWQLHTDGTEATWPELPAWIEGPHRFAADRTGRSQAGRFYLMRPDGCVAASLPIDFGHVRDADLRPPWPRTTSATDGDQSILLAARRRTDTSAQTVYICDHCGGRNAPICRE